MIMWPAEFLAGVRRLCDRYGTLLIADEVLTDLAALADVRLRACRHHARYHVLIESHHGRIPATWRDGRNDFDLPKLSE